MKKIIIVGLLSLLFTGCISQYKLDNKVTKTATLNFIFNGENAHLNTVTLFTYVSPKYDATDTGSLLKEKKLAERLDGKITKKSIKIEAGKKFRILTRHSNITMMCDNVIKFIPITNREYNLIANISNKDKSCNVEVFEVQKVNGKTIKRKKVKLLENTEVKEILGPIYIPIYVP